jgi:Sulfotransferase family
MTLEYHGEGERSRSHHSKKQRPSQQMSMRIVCKFVGWNGCIVLVALVSFNLIIAIKLLHPMQPSLTTTSSSIYYFLIPKLASDVTTPSLVLTQQEQTPNENSIHFTTELKEFSGRLLLDKTTEVIQLPHLQQNALPQQETLLLGSSDPDIGREQSLISSSSSIESNTTSPIPTLHTLMQGIQKQALDAIHITRKIAEPSSQAISRTVQNNIWKKNKDKYRSTWSTANQKVTTGQSRLNIRVSSNTRNKKKPNVDVVKKKTQTDPNPIFYQKMWTRKDIVKVLDSPECSTAIANAKRMQPRNVAICPLCTAGMIGDTFPYAIQYMKIPKAGSSTMVKYLTNQTNQLRQVAQTLCVDQPHTDIRYTMVRNPLERIYSAYNEVDSPKKEWLYSPNVTYRQYGSVGRPHRIHRFLQFLSDYFNGYMNSWDAGMAHHMLGAALHLDAVRTEADGITKNNLLLPDIVGRLEYVDDFMSSLRGILRQMQTTQQKNRSENNNDTMMKNNLNSTSRNNDTEIEAVRVRNNGNGNYRGIDKGLEWLVETLFPEDFVCFGYPLSFQNTTSIQLLAKNKKMYKTRKSNYKLSKQYFPSEVLEAIENNNQRLAHLHPPSCNSHYSKGK